MDRIMTQHLRSINGLLHRASRHPTLPAALVIRAFSRVCTCLDDGSVKLSYDRELQDGFQCVQFRRVRWQQPQDDQTIKS
ncbi:hypothetical protein ACVJBD_004923 [Rhizobium mongolense]